MIEIDRSFPHRYAAEVGSDLPPRGEAVRRFARRVEDERKDGLVVRVTPESGSPWTGVFVFGSLAARAKSGLYSCPDDRFLCVVSGGNGYIVSTEDPSAFEVVSSEPIVDVIPAVDQGLLVFVDPWGLVACREGGEAWRTGRIAADGLVVEGVTRDQVNLRGDSLEREDATFVVRLSDGRVIES